MKFEIEKSDQSEQYFFRIVASNGQILANSEQYVDKRSARDAVDSIKREAAGAEVEEQG